MNLALAVTYVRICLTIPLIGLFFAPGAWGVWGSGLVFLVAGASDALDGWLARHLDCETKLGAVLDPVADKIITAAALVLLASDERAPAIAVTVLLVREFLVSGLREALAGPSFGVLAVSLTAKTKTATLFVAITLLLLAPGLPAPSEVALAGTVLLWVAMALALVSGADYVLRAVHSGSGRGD